MDIFTLHPLFRVRRARVWGRGFCVVTSLAISAQAYAASEPSLITGEKKSYGYSWQQELKLGAEADKEITENMGPNTPQNPPQYPQQPAATPAPQNYPQFPQPPSSTNSNRTPTAQPQQTPTWPR